MEQLTDNSDFIDPDEGYRREIDFEVDAREAFAAYALPCENCGAPWRKPGRPVGTRKPEWAHAVSFACTN